MPYRKQINRVLENKNNITQQIKHLEMIGASYERINELKHREQIFQRELSKLYKLQYEEETERVGYDDDR